MQKRLFELSNKSFGQVRYGTIKWEELETPTLQEILVSINANLTLFNDRTSINEHIQSEIEKHGWIKPEKAIVAFLGDGWIAQELNHLDLVEMEAEALALISANEMFAVIVDSDLVDLLNVAHVQTSGYETKEAFSEKGEIKKVSTPLVQGVPRGQLEFSEITQKEEMKNIQAQMRSLQEQLTKSKREVQQLQHSYLDKQDQLIKEQDARMLLQMEMENMKNQVISSSPQTEEEIISEQWYESEVYQLTPEKPDEAEAFRTQERNRQMAWKLQHDLDDMKRSLEIMQDDYEEKKELVKKLSSENRTLEMRVNELETDKKTNNLSKSIDGRTYLVNTPYAGLTQQVNDESGNRAEIEQIRKSIQAMKIEARNRDLFLKSCKQQNKELTRRLEKMTMNESTQVSQAEEIKMKTLPKPKLRRSNAVKVKDITYQIPSPVGLSEFESITTDTDEDNKENVFITPKKNLSRIQRGELSRKRIMHLDFKKLGLAIWNPEECDILTHIDKCTAALEEIGADELGVTEARKCTLLVSSLPKEQRYKENFVSKTAKQDYSVFCKELARVLSAKVRNRMEEFIATQRRSGEDLLHFLHRILMLYKGSHQIEGDGWEKQSRDTPPIYSKLYSSLYPDEKVLLHQRVDSDLEQGNLTIEKLKHEIVDISKSASTKIRAEKIRPTIMNIQEEPKKDTKTVRFQNPIAKYDERPNYATKTPLRCYHCNEEGHFVARCPHKEAQRWPKYNTYRRTWERQDRKVPYYALPKKDMYNKIVPREPETEEEGRKINENGEKRSYQQNE